MSKKEQLIEPINLNLRTVEDFYSGFSDEETKIVDYAVVDYINDSAKTVAKSSKIQLNLKIADIKTNEEKDECKRALKAFYKYEIEDIKYEIKKMTIISMLLLLIGFGLVVALNFLVEFNAPYIIKTILDIMAWVFVWEAVDIFCFRRTIKKFNLIKVLKIYNAEIIIK